MASVKPRYVTAIIITELIRGRFEVRKGLDLWFMWHALIPWNKPVNFTDI